MARNLLLSRPKLDSCERLHLDKPDLPRQCRLAGVAGQFGGESNRLPLPDGEGFADQSTVMRRGVSIRHIYVCRYRGKRGHGEATRTRPTTTRCPIRISPGPITRRASGGHGPHASIHCFHISPYTTRGSTASFSYLFFTIYDYTTAQFVFNDGFLAPSTSSIVLLSRNTLTNGHNYAYEVDFSNRDIVPSLGTASDAQLGFDLRTDGAFSTLAGVPEPSTLGMFACGSLFSAWGSPAGGASVPR